MKNSKVTEVRRWSSAIWTAETLEGLFHVYGSALSKIV